MAAWLAVRRVALAVPRAGPSDPARSLARTAADEAGVAHGAAVRSAYRDLLALLRAAPWERRLADAAEARRRIAEHAAEPDTPRRHELLKELVAKVSFLRTTTPRRLHRRPAATGGVYVLRGGELVRGRGESQGARVATGILDMQEAREMHHRLHRRQHFGRDPGPVEPM